MRGSRSRPALESELPETEKVDEFTDVGKVEEISLPTSDTATDVPIVKRDHTHGRVLYKAGTPVADMNLDETTSNFLKSRNII